MNADINFLLLRYPVVCLIHRNLYHTNCSSETSLHPVINRAAGHMFLFIFTNRSIRFVLLWNLEIPLDPSSHCNDHALGYNILLKKATKFYCMGTINHRGGRGCFTRQQRKRKCRTSINSIYNFKNLFIRSINKRLKPLLADYFLHSIGKLKLHLIAVKFTINIIYGFKWTSF